jgi:hypothetical protein
VKIFANADGSDETGDGSQDNPYLTFQRAVQDLPKHPLPGFRYMIDITNLGEETLPPNYALPALEAPWGIEAAWSSPFAADYYPFTTMLGIDIIAKPTLATLAQGSNVLLAGDMTVSFDPDTNLIKIQTNQDYGAADSLKGLLVQDGVALRGIIWHNTAGPNSTIYLTIPHTPDEFIIPVFESNLTGFPPAFPPGFPVPFPPGGSLQIVERTAKFITQKDPTNIIQGGFLIAGCGALSIRGVDIELAPAFTNPAGYDLEIFRSATICLEGCRLDGLLTIHSPGQVCVINTHIHDAVVASEIPLGFFSVYFERIPSFGLTWITPTAVTLLGFVLDGCAALGPRYHPLQPAGRGPMTDLQLRSGVIMNSVADMQAAPIADPTNFPAPFSPFPPLASPTPGYGILLRGGHGIVDHVKIFGAASDAIHFEGNGLLELRSVTGGQGGVVFGDLADNPNGGYGLFLDDGGHVRVIDQDPVPNAVLTNVRGTPDDIHVGELPDLTLWTDLYALSPENYFDVQLAGGSGVTAQGTGSRLFVKPPNP